MIERIFSFAQETPEAVAIHHGGAALNYRQFATQIASARAEFIEQQVCGEGIVALEVGDLQDYWISALALNTLGLTTIGVRTAEELADLPLPMLRYLVSSASSPYLAKVSRETRERLISPPTMRATPSWPTPQEMAGGCHLLFSSGTTGRKKMLSCTLAISDVPGSWGFEVDANMVHHLFDYGPWTLAGFEIPRNVWAHGGAVILSQGVERHAALLNEKGTHAAIMPFFLDEILSAPEGAFPFNPNLQLSIGGGTVTAWQIDEAKRRICPLIYNMLATTEVGAIALTRLDTPDDQRWHQLLPGCGIEIVDEAGCRVPVGAVGELRVPIGNMRSAYCNDPETTGQFFRDGWFYPGDLAVMREDGRIALQGRVTAVINSNGSKIDPEPLETLLKAQLGVKECCLVSCQDSGGQEQLYIVVESPVTLPTSIVDGINEALREFLIGAISGEIFTIAQFPRTDTGKVIRREVQSRIAQLLSQRLSEAA